MCFDNSGIPSRLRAVEDGTWFPLPGSVAADLGNNHHGGRCPPRTLRDLRKLVKLGNRFQGQWWLEQLDTPAGSLSADDQNWVHHAWSEVGNDRSPWRRQRRVA